MLLVKYAMAWKHGVRVTYPNGQYPVFVPMTAQEAAELDREYVAIEDSHEYLGDGEWA